MHLTPLFRAVVLSRRSRRSAHAGSTTHAAPRRRAAMGLDVQPVHGRHCICERCQRQASATQ